MRDQVINTILETAKKNQHILLVTGDLGFGVLDSFRKECPDQFFNAGVSEQNMTGLSAGLALEGKTVCVYSIGNFPTFRCLEQIRNDVSYHKADVKIICVGAGFSYGSLGMSHHATEDIAILRAVPGIEILSPSDIYEAEKLTEYMLQSNKPCYLRLDKSSAGRNANPDSQCLDGKLRFIMSNSERLHSRPGIVIFATGGILQEALAVADKIEKYHVSLYSVPFIEPFDVSGFWEILDGSRLIVSVEEHSIRGGLGSLLAEEILEYSGKRPDLLRVGMKDGFSEHTGSQAYLREMHQMDSDSILNAITERMSKLSD